MESPYPKLTRDVVIDDQALAAAVDEMLRLNVEYLRHAQVILSFQTELRDLVAETAWQLFLRVEELHNARLADATAAVAMWAFEQGQRCGGRHQ